jgi:hypothetical protein
MNAAAPPATPPSGELAWQRVAGAPDDARGFSAEVLRGIGRIWKERQRVLLASFGGASMEPTILAGEEVQLVCGEECAIGDVIAFIYLDQVAVHRVMATGRGGWLLTCGDAQTVPDIPVTDPAAIIGRVVSVRRGDVVAPLAAASLNLVQRAVRSLFRLLMPLGPVTVRRAVLAGRALRSIRYGRLPDSAGGRVSMKETP